MEEAGDFAGIGVPFAAGVAAGLILFPSPCGIRIMPMAFLEAAIPILGLLSVRHLDSRTDFRLIRFFFAAIFLFTGIFCSLNSTLGSGIPTPAGPLERLATDCGLRLRSAIDAIPYPSRTTNALLKALLTGDRSGLDRETVEVFRNSGASHLLALSGLHLGVLYLILAKLLAPLGNSPRSRIFKYSSTIAAAAFYTVMTGASASIVRAFLFIVIHESAKILGREAPPSRVLLSALTIQLAFEPQVISSLGFQLSYLAMAGITFIYPPLKRIYPRGEGHRWLPDPFRRTWDAAMLAVSCQAGTAPLVWLRFRTFPRYFLITNLVALPLTSAVMVLSLTTIALFCLGICPDALVLLDDKAAGALVYCLGIISSM